VLGRHPIYLEDQLPDQHTSTGNNNNNYYYYYYYYYNHVTATANSSILPANAE